jgi:hypothetical protein
MSSNVVPFRDPYLPLEGTRRLKARRLFRASCKTIAAKAVAEACSEAFNTPGVGNLGCDDGLPVFVAAMRRELRKTGLF